MPPGKPYPPKKTTSGTAGTTGSGFKPAPGVNPGLEIYYHPAQIGKGIKTTGGMTVGGPGGVSFRPPQVVGMQSSGTPSVYMNTAPAKAKPVYTPHTNSFTGIPGTQNPRANQVGITSTTFKPGGTGTYETGIPSALQPAVAAETASGTNPLLAALLGLLKGGGQSSPAVGAIQMPDIPRTDISGLYGQFSPSINTAYDALMSQLDTGQQRQQADFNGIMDRIRATYPQARADVNQPTAQGQSDLQNLMNSFGLGQVTGGEMNQRWAGDAARLNNLAQQDQASQLGSLDTLVGAKNSMYDTFRTAGQGARAGSLADLASAVVGGQSNIDAARSQGLADLASAALSGQLNLANLSQTQQQNAFQQKMSMANLLTDLMKMDASSGGGSGGGSTNPLDVGLPSTTYTENQVNPGLLQDITGITDPTMANLANEAWAQSEGNVDKMYAILSKQLYAKPGPPGLTLDPETGQLVQMPAQTDQDIALNKPYIQQILERIRPYTRLYGGKSTNVETTTRTPKIPDSTYQNMPYFKSSDMAMIAKALGLG